ncbi:S1/P1 nuclease [Wenyingzhuangia sp. IMCC45574]
MKKLCLLICLMSLSAFAENDWGQTGHRTVGEIAKEHISKKTTKKIKALLKGESLAFVSTYADEIRSDKKFKHYGPWHYVNLVGNKKYKQDSINPKGDVVQAIKTCVLKIRDKQTSQEDKAFHLRMLVHFVGDLHMPLHVGNKKDYGGNKIKVKWFGEKTNLHSVWDTKMIESYNMSYVELSNNTKELSKKEFKDLQKGSLLSWTKESRELALKVYKTAKEGDYLSYKYMYYNFPVAREQLQKGGIRLAKILDEVFKRKSPWLDRFLADV